MHLTRGKIMFFASIGLALFAWQNLSRSVGETAVLRIPNVANQDMYVNVWIVDDGGSLWIRAENPKRVWLDFLRSEPVIQLRRGSGTAHYKAVPLDTDGGRGHVDPLFRAKYGLADELRSHLPGRYTVPIRLEPV